MRIGVFKIIKISHQGDFTVYTNLSHGHPSLIQLHCYINTLASRMVLMRSSNSYTAIQLAKISEKSNHKNAASKWLSDDALNEHNMSNGQLLV